MAVAFYINNKSSQVAPGKTLFEYAEELEVKVPTSCRKQGKCKECMVEITEGEELLSERTDKEKHLKDAFRLSCCCKIESQQGMVRCHTMRRGIMEIENKALNLPERIKDFQIDPMVSRRGNEIYYDNQLIDHHEGPIYGIAIDLGTTTVVLRLINLETGDIVADSSFENPQRFGGSDVMSRIHYDSMEGKGLLKKTLTGYLRHAIDEFPVDNNSIYEIVVVGNSTMRDLLFGLDVYSIGQNPYQSITEIEMSQGLRTTTSLSARARKLGLTINKNGMIYSLPIISGHVGADASSCMLAVDLANEEELVAVMDIGTNTELIVGNKHRILAASCPAGPAFEGGAISCGMPGLPGAIESIALGDNGTINFEVIGEKSPEGICGSGLVDLLSELLRTDRMNHLGRFEDIDQLVIAHNAQQPIYFNESDVSELAQAKGANVAGLHIVMSRYGIAFNDLDRFYLAGGFGKHLKIEASKRIGLIPDLPDEKIVQIGNASIEGASIALLSGSKRKELEALVQRIEHCKLESHPDFFDCFVEGCQFNRVVSLSTNQKI